MKKTHVMHREFLSKDSMSFPKADYVIFDMDGNSPLGMLGLIMEPQIFSYRTLN